jgi:hypothetical protein
MASIDAVKFKPIGSTAPVAEHDRFMDESSSAAPAKGRTDG